MKNPNTTRRNFLQTATVGAAGVVLGCPWVARGGIGDVVGIEEPLHGAILNRRHGQQTADGLKIRVSGKAPLGDQVAVNKTPAARSGTGFTSEIVLREKETEIVAAGQGRFGCYEHRIRVIWDKNSFPRYRFSIDDNSFFLRDVAQKKYKSLFDCFYLEILKTLNVEYGARFVLNIYYATEDGFELPQFPDRYQGEWRDNSGWLKLAFHAYMDKPDRPYQYAPPSQLMADMAKVEEQILRFAGEETLTPPTVIHWGMVQPTALKPLYEHGVRVLSGGFRHRNNICDINYFLDAARSEYVSRHDGLMDFNSGIIFSVGDITCNNTPVEKVAATLEPLARDPNTAEIMDLFTHEQYFWPFYKRYVPDHAERLDTAIRWCTEHGYKPVFFHEGLMGAPA